MTASGFSTAMPGWFRSGGEVRLVCEIAADYVAAARYQHGALQEWATQPLPAGAVRPAPLAENIAELPAVQQALQQVVGALADGQRRCVLLVPDLLARVALLEFDDWPAQPEEADSLLRWRLKKDLPFDIAQAVLSYQVQPGHAAAHEVLAVACLRSLLRPYESCAEALGLHPGWVTLSTLAALGCVSAPDGAARLLVKRDQGSLSLAILHGENIRLFRSLPLTMPGSPAEVDALFEKIFPAVVFFQDQWGQPVSEVLLAGLEPAALTLAKKFEKEAGCSARGFDLGAHALPPSAGTGAGPDQRLLPCLGWVRGETS